MPTRAFSGVPAALLLLLGSGALTSGCLPGDGRPDPGQVTVTTSPSEATTTGFTTKDGWTVTFDRFLTAVGNTHIYTPGDLDDTCNDYSKAAYVRLFDFTAVVEEKVGSVFGLGQCNLDVRFGPPWRDALIGVGATSEDKAQMRRRSTDNYALSQPIAVIAQGRAKRGSLSKRFSWFFRHAYELESCPNESGSAVDVFDINGGDDITHRMIIRAEELFRQWPDDDAPLVFDRYANADQDNDGWITLNELEEVGISLETYLGLWMDAPIQPEEDTTLTVAQLVYGILLQRIARFAGGGACRVQLHNR